jgi:hypothetical protein
VPVSPYVRTVKTLSGATAVQIVYSSRLMVSAFEGNKTMLPVITSFMAAHDLPDVTVVADAGMVSEANQKAIEAAGLSFILGMKIPHVPYAVAQWHREHPGEDIPDGHAFTQHWPAGPNGGRRNQVIYHQYRHDRARRTLRGIDEQVKKAEQAVAGKAPVKRNRFIQLSGGTLSAYNLTSIAMYDLMSRVLGVSSPDSPESLRCSASLETWNGQASAQPPRSIDRTLSPSPSFRLSRSAWLFFSRSSSAGL